VKRWDSSHEGSFSDYVDQIAIPQVKEILSKYGPIAVIWWDTPQDMTPEIAEKFEAALSSQPGIIRNSRLFKANPGDFRVMEGSVPAAGTPGTPWEVCMMMNESWGYSRAHQEWVDAGTVIRQIIQTASLGGNYLLNVGPTASGDFPQEAVGILHGVGTWMKVNGEAIYGTTGFPTKKLWQQGRFTQKPGRLFANVFLWPSQGKLTIPVMGKIKRVSLLVNPSVDLSFEQGEDGVTVIVPEKIPTTEAGVLVLEVDGKAVEANVFPALSSGPDESFDLLAMYATLRGPGGGKPGVVLGKREGTNPALTNDPAEGFKIGGFSNSGDLVDWKIDIQKPGKYAVIVYAGVQKNAPADLSVSVASGAQRLEKPLISTGGSQTFQPIELGVLEFDRPGDQVISLSVKSAEVQPAACNVWRVQLRPIVE
jgi:alpha-L-fucosidase